MRGLIGEALNLAADLSISFMTNQKFLVSSPTAVLILVVLRRLVAATGRVGLQHRGAPAARQERQPALPLGPIKFALKTQIR